MSLYFDLETTGVGPAGKITCAATSTADATTTWHSGLAHLPPAVVEHLDWRCGGCGQGA